MYGDAVREARVLLGEAWDKICGKRLRPLVPVLIEVMERHGHVQLAAEVRTGLLAMSAAMVNRSVRQVRGEGGRRYTTPVAPSAAARLAALLALAWPAQAGAQPGPQGPAGGGALLGDAGGVRQALGKHGISLGLQNTSEVFGNLNGGRARGAQLDGQNALGLGVDLEKAAGLKGGLINLSALQNYGHGLSAGNVDNLNLISSIEARRSAWLFELWYQQSFMGGAVDVRLGQLAADQEFIITQYGNWFVNAAFGWPTLPSVDLPAGGPAAPLATPGVRLRAKPLETLTLLFGAFNGDPAGPGLGNPQRRDASGSLFRLGDGLFAIAEAQYAINGGKGAKGPPVTLKLGGWYHEAASPNQFFATEGLTAVPQVAAGSAVARESWSAYAVADAMLLPGPGGKGGLAAFARVATSPQGRSAVSLELAGGLVYVGPFGRDGDQAGLAVTSVRAGQALGSGAAASRFMPHGYETVVELSYQAQALPWLQVQPDAQYVVTPGGEIPNPSQPGRKVGSAAVLGLRTVAAF